MGLFKKVEKEVIDCRNVCRAYNNPKVKAFCDGLENGTRDGVCPRGNLLNNQYTPCPMGLRLEAWRQKTRG